MRKCLQTTCLLLTFTLLPNMITAATGFPSMVNYLFDEKLRDRVGVNFYVSGSSEITTKAELAALVYDFNEDMSIIMGTSMASPNHFHYLDVSWRNPWTFFSWQSSLELGIGRYLSNAELQSHVSQSISFDYPLDQSMSVQVLLKRFSKAIDDLSLGSSIVAMGLGLRI